MMDVSVKECKRTGLDVISGASFKATQCEFSENGWIGWMCMENRKDSHHNELDGVWAGNEGTLVELRGEQTEIHHNGRFGLSAMFNATINIYIPSRSITALVHDNSRDLVTSNVRRWQNSITTLIVIILELKLSFKKHHQ